MASMYITTFDDEVNLRMSTSEFVMFLYTIVTQDNRNMDTAIMLSKQILDIIIALSIDSQKEEKV